MNATIDQLERLAALHHAGSLSDAEYQDQKARLLSQGPAPTTPGSTSSSVSAGEASPKRFGQGGAGTTGDGSSTERSEDVTARIAALSPAWQNRIAFFAAHGSPFSKTFNKALTNVPVGQRHSYMFNPWAFVFGIFYYFYLGIPKRGVGLFAFFAVVWLILFHNNLEDTWSRAFSIIVEVTFAFLANYFYYIKVTQGRDEWDPLKDLRKV